MKLMFNFQKIIEVKVKVISDESNEVVGDVLSNC